MTVEMQIDHYLSALPVRLVADRWNQGNRMNVKLISPSPTGAARPHHFHLPEPPVEIPPPPMRTIKPPGRTIIVVLQSEAQDPWKSPPPSLLIRQHTASIYLPKKAIIN